MTRPFLTLHGRASVPIVSRCVAELLAGVALDPSSDLPRPVRAALADLVITVDVAACRHPGVEPLGAGLRAALIAALPAEVTSRPP